MEYIVTQGNAMDAIKKTYFANDGDYYEKSYWPLLKEKFPHCEDYWRHFVVTMTKRMEATVTDQRKRTLPRQHISQDIVDLASLHYSMFMNLVCAYEHMMNPRLSSFEDFYTHLAAACDLAEDFLFGTRLVVLECTGGRGAVPQVAKKEDFQKLAEEQNDSQPGRGNAAPTAPNRQGILDDYFAGSDEWRDYKVYSRKVRDYRDAIIRNYQIGRVLVVGDITLVPRKERIQDYRKWPSALLAAEDTNKVQSHFIDMKEQMLLDIETLEVMLNRLWERPISDMKRLFFDDKNAVILGKYQITPM